MKKNIRYFSWIAIVLTMLFVVLLSVMVITEINQLPLPKKYNPHLNLTGANLDYYYIDFSQSKYLFGEKSYKFDKTGLPLFFKAGKWHYHPVMISQFALGAFDYHQETGDSTAKVTFLRCANWLAENLKPHRGFFYWEYHFKIEFPGGIYENPWFSAMTQGQGASVLLRAYVLTKEEKFLLAARQAINPIFADLTQGGISTVKGADYIFPQEYPTSPPSDILNGAIYAFFGVYDYLRATGDPEIHEKYQTILSTFASEIEQYDTGNWSLYCRWPGYWATPHYNSDHITQLKILYQISGIQKFNHYSKKFESYHFSWKNRARYVFQNHLRQLKEFSLEDLAKIPAFLKRSFAY